MQPALLVRITPAGPMRFGPASGDRAQVEPCFHSDSFYSALTRSLAALGHLEAWLDATARRGEGSLVRVSSWFPFLGRNLLVTPPRSHWPPLSSGRVRWQGARFVPMSVVQDLLAGRPPQDERWEVDGPSKCLIPLGAASPFRYSMRSTAPVDRLTQTSARGYESACLEFHPTAGLWTVVVFTSDEAKAAWLGPIEAALRLMADTGVGGERSRGWGRFLKPEFHEAPFPAIVLGRRDEKPEEDPSETAYWLLSMYAPAASDAIEWTRGAYQDAVRSGRVESNRGWGAESRSVRMVAEGSVLLASAALAGTAVDVAPEGFGHPVYRAGYAVAIPVPWRASTLSQSLPPLRAPEPEPVPGPTPEPAPEPAPESTPEPATEPVSESMPEPATEPVSESMPEPVADPAPDPTPEPAPEPIPEPVAEPTSEPPPAEEETP